MIDYFSNEWCMQNICMNFVVYWCIFLHIIMLLVVIVMFYNDLWGFSIDPLILVITLQNRKPCFAYFDVSETFSDSNWPGFFQALIFYHEKHLEEKKSTRRGPGAKQDQVAWEACLSLGPPLPSIFVSWPSAWPKSTYIKTSLDDHEMRRRVIHCHPSLSPDPQLGLKALI
jgi:hypothetical protein